MKTCIKCGQSKDVTGFGKCRSRHDGLKNRCLACDAEYLAAYYAANKVAIKEKQAAYKAEHKEQMRAARAGYYLKNSEKVKAYGAAYRAADPEKIKARKADYYLKNRDSIRASQAERHAANRNRIKPVRAAYYAKNRERIQFAQAAFRAKDPAKTRVSRARSSVIYVARHPERVKARKAAYHTAHPEKARIYSQTRRARKRNSDGTLSHGLVEKLFGLQKGLCPCCTQPLGDDYHLDHVMPLALGGQNVDGNMQLLRHICNKQKHAKHPVDFMQSRGFLL